MALVLAADDPLAVAATDAVQAGDLETLERLLSDHPDLATARIGDPVAITGPAQHGTAGDFDVTMPHQRFDDGLDDGEIHAEAPRQLGSDEFAGKVQRLERELNHHVQRQPGLLERCRRHGALNVR